MREPTPIPQLTAPPERIFVSVDESTGRSTLSFAPAGIAATISHDDDGQGEQALRIARALLATYPSCTIVGPHFHASAAARGRPRNRRRP